MKNNGFVQYNNIHFLFLLFQTVYDQNDNDYIIYYFIVSLLIYIGFINDL